MHTLVNPVYKDNVKLVSTVNMRFKSGRDSAPKADITAELPNTHCLVESISSNFINLFEKSIEIKQKPFVQY